MSRTVGEAAASPGALLLVGRVAGAFGVRGELRLTSYTADPLALIGYRDLKREDGAPALTVLGGRLARTGPAGAEIVVRAAESPTRDAAEALRGLKLHVPRSALPPPDDENDFYHADLIGLLAVDPQGQALGRLKAVHDFGAGDVLEVDPGDGRASFMTPFTREVAPVVDVAGGRLVLVRPPEVEPDAADGDEARGDD